MYDLELHALLRISTGPQRYDYPREEMEEISATIDAIQQLNERAKTLDKKQRTVMPLHGGRVKVWAIPSASFRDRPVYMDRKIVYIQMGCGALEPIKPRALGGVSNMNGMSAEELSFIARFI